jgi:hypothetical protein
LYQEANGKQASQHLVFPTYETLIVCEMTSNGKLELVTQNPNCCMGTWVSEKAPVVERAHERSHVLNKGY